MNEDFINLIPKPYILHPNPYILHPNSQTGGYTAGRRSHFLREAVRGFPAQRYRRPS